MTCDPRAGARNLIVEAIGAKPGETLAIIAEDPALGVYDGLVPRCIAEVATEQGIAARIVPVGNHAGLDDIPPAAIEALETCDHIVFHARMGDTMRFDEIGGRATKTMSYALDLGLLGGAGCTLPHRMLREIEAAWDQVADNAPNWRITCPLGTDLAGTQDVAAVAAGQAPDFTVKLFPVCSPRPISCATGSGRVAVAHWLMASDHRPYDDALLPLDEPLLATVENGRIVDWSGPAALVARVRAHYQRVADTFGIDGDVVHSWHAGLNPGIFFPFDALGDMDRWSKVTFANPRYLHIHTCGDFAPGEIAWSLFDASVELDGTVHYESGRFRFLDCPEVLAIAARHGLAAEALVARRDIGIGF